MLYFGTKTIKSINIKRFIMKSLVVFGLVVLSSAFAIADVNETLHGNIRVGYQHGVDTLGNGNELAIGATVGYETKRWNNILVGGSISAVEGGSNGDGGYFIHGVKNDVLLLSEAFVKGFYANSEITIGRQLLDTPFANSDDIGMIPNRFGGIKIVNSSIKETKITAGYINSMAVGTDDENQAKFDKLGVFMAGVEYAGMDNLVLSSWYYQKPSELRTIYFDAQYINKIGRMDYEIAAQYANQNINNQVSNIYGGKIFVSDKVSGVSLNGAYTKTVGVVANNLYGGGPWYTSVEHSTIADIGDNGSALKLGINIGKVGINGLSFGIEKLWLKGDDDTYVSNSGVMASYEYNDSLTFRGYYNKIADGRENVRVFLDYKF